MKAQTTHNIICLEAAWEYSEATQNVFSLNTQPILNWLREIHECDIVYRNFRVGTERQKVYDSVGKGYATKSEIHLK